jgi:hypothetical protein
LPNGFFLMVVKVVVWDGNLRVIIDCIWKQQWKHWKCKDPVTKPWKFRVYFMIMLVNEKLESVRIQ